MVLCNTLSKIHLTVLTSLLVLWILRLYEPGFHFLWGGHGLNPYSSKPGLLDLHELYNIVQAFPIAPVCFYKWLQTALSGCPREGYLPVTPNLG